jgi:hypothetical protein
MNYQVKRLNPYWIIHPMIPTAVAIGVICGAVGFLKEQSVIMIIGGIIAGAGLVAAIRPVFSALLGTLGLLGGFLTFVIVPNSGAADMGMALRLLSAVLFGLFYMVLMDALVLVVCVLYNFFSGAVGLSGLTLELGEAAETEEGTEA